MHTMTKQPLQLYNTRTRKVEEFKPIQAGKVGLYTCGPTVYHFAHIGNLRTYVFEDILKRVLKLNKFVINHVMNITDVGHLTSDSDSGDDKMEKGAAREGKKVWEVAEFYTKEFKKDLVRLNSKEPSIWCKATDHIKEQIQQIKQLEEKGYTYIIEDGVYFNTAKFPKYGDFARLDITNLQAGIRVELAAGKKNPTDFALWKFSPKDGTKRQMEWPSPWGIGFPGWHIECSAMATKYLGNHFDIHCGGVDHISVHHTNEIAQAECALGQTPWVNYWMHGEFLVIGKDKMAKSGENFLTIQVLIDKGYDPLAYRYYLLQAHYRKQLSFSFDALDAAQTGLKKLRASIANLGSEIGTVAQSYKEQFESALNDDLNTPQAIALIHEILADASLSNPDKRATLAFFDDVFALDLTKEEAQIEIPQNVTELLEKRKIAREQKNFALSDKLRDEIAALGFVVKDSKDGQKISKQ